MKKTGQGKFIIAVVLGILLILLSTPAVATKIKFTRHNLSSTSQYNIKATSETQICVFCHTPHSSDSTEAPLWNRDDTTQTFTMATTQWVNWGRPATGADGTPTSTSKKCLSCHDGSIAIGSIRRGGGTPVIPIPMTDSGTGKLDPDGSLASTPFGGYDLRGGHVISFNYNQFYTNAPAGVKSNFISWASISIGDQHSMFDKQGRMQCHSCHDPHEDKCNDTSKTVGNDPFWRKLCSGGKNISVCETCHSSTFDYYTAPKYPF